MIRFAALLACCVCGTAPAKPQPAAFTFIVSGDSRNCGNVVMPAIAAAAQAQQAAFYWHLGDLRWISDIDDDFRTLHPSLGMAEYLTDAWPDAQRSQLAAFGSTPLYLGIGNHETVAPKSREEFLLSFAGWLDAAPIREQRLKDDPLDVSAHSYYHWIRDGIDFINLDNATPDEFSAVQLAWLKRRLRSARHDKDIRAVILGMHEALPESLARGHSMSDFPSGEDSGIEVYRHLLELQRKKPVYVLASHSHYIMQGIFNSEYWRAHGGVLPGWIIGTAGAYRYALPPGSGQAAFAKTHVYGYLLARVAAGGEHVKDPVAFEFKELRQSDTPPQIAARYGEALVHHCFAQNAQSLQ